MFPRVEARNYRKVQCSWCPRFFSNEVFLARPHHKIPTFLTWTKRPLVQSIYWIVPLLGISCPARGTLYYFFTLGTRGSLQVGADWVLVLWAGDSCGRSICYSTSSSFCFFCSWHKACTCLYHTYIIICFFLVLLLLFKVWEGYRLLSNFYFEAKRSVANVGDPSNKDDGYQRIVNPITRTIKTKKRNREHKI